MSEINSTEQWRDVVGHEGFYMVSNHGRVKSVSRNTVSFSRSGNKYVKSVAEKFMLGTPNRDGYLVVVLSKNGQIRRTMIHILVLEAFVGPKPDGKQGRHFPDANPANNRLDNLGWCTPIENSQDKIAHGTTGKGRPVSQEMRDRISKKLTGRKATLEMRQKMSAGQQAMLSDPERGKKHREKLSIAQKKRWAERKRKEACE